MKWTYLSLRVVWSITFSAFCLIFLGLSYLGGVWVIVWGARSLFDKEQGWILQNLGWTYAGSSISVILCFCFLYFSIRKMQSRFSGRKYEFLLYPFDLSMPGKEKKL
jgi:hypothetical protein